MLKIIKTLEKKKGFTLIEILVVIAILGVVVTAASNLFISAYNLYIENKEKVEIQSELRFLTNFIDESIKYSDNISLYDGAPSVSSNEAAIGIKDSYVIIKNNSNERNLSSIKIDELDFKGNINILTLTIEKGEYSIETDILLNNHSFTSSPTEKNFILYEKQN